MPYDIVTVGEILVEVLTEKAGQPLDRPGTLLGPYPSGAPAIAIDQAALMGARTAIIAKIGKDDFGRLNKERLSADGVDISHIVETDGNSTGVAFVTYFPDGERQFIFHFEKAACGELEPEDVKESVVARSRYLHLMGCSVTGSPTMAAAILRAVRFARDNGVKISFDPNIRPELLRGAVMDHYRNILDACEILLTGRKELEALFGRSAEDAVRTLLEQKERIVVTKDGARGACAFTRSEALRIAACPAVEADPTGAGDSFDGAFLAMLCEGHGIRTAMRYGTAAGALAVSKRGPMEGNTSREGVEAFMAKVGSMELLDIPNPWRA